MVVTRRRRNLGGDLYGLSSESFTSIIPDVPLRITINGEALEKVGKTYFALTAPDPIIVFNFDRSLDGVVQQFRDKGKRIIVAGMPGSGGEGKQKRLPHYDFSNAKPEREKGEAIKGQSYTKKVMKAVRPIWRQFVKDYKEALRSDARTIVLDTGTGFWLLARHAMWGAVSPPGAHLAGTIKEEFSSLVREAEETDKNVIWLHRVKPEYVDKTDKSGNKQSVKTSRFERAGHSEMGFDVQMNVRMRKEKVSERVRGQRVTRYVRSLEIVDCRLNDEVAGEVLEDEFCSFPFLMSTVFGNDPEEWGYDEDVQEDKE